MSSITNFEKYSFRSNGKLLLTGEYFVLDGAKALATPTLPGQTLDIKIKESSEEILSWKSFDDKGKVWFEASYASSNFNMLSSTDQEISERLQNILKELSKLNPSIFESKKNFEITTQLDFDRQYGLGTSSTLIYNLALWAKVDPFKLLQNTFGGSGYDLACAGAKKPIIYEIANGVSKWENVNFNPSFQDKLYLLYLGKKQNSREGIKRYREQATPSQTLVNEISAISKAFCEVSGQEEFDKLIQQHEEIISTTLKLPKVKDVYFKDFPVEAKSLGAWGGDFILLSNSGSWKELKKFTQNIGMDNLFPYKSLVL